MSELEITGQQAQDLLEGTEGIVMLYRHYDALPYEFPTTYKWFHTISKDEVWLGLECDGDMHIIHKLAANTYNYKSENKIITKFKEMTKSERTGIKIVIVIAVIFIINAIIGLV